MKYKALLFSLFATANLFAQHPAIHFEIETDQPWTISEHQTVGACNLSAYGRKKNKTK
mgnify:CR=1 FL=1